MAKIGNLWFDLGIKDLTEKDIKRITKSIEKKLKDTGVDLGVNTDGMISQIQEALSKRKFNVDIVVDKANVAKVVQEALTKAGYNPNVTASDVRASRITVNEKKAEKEAKAMDLLEARRQKTITSIEKENLAIQRNKKALDKYNSSFSGLTKNMRTQFNLAVQLRNQLADLFSLYAIESFIKSIAEVGGEFQKQRVALRAIFGDLQKADVIFERIKNLSVESPFEFKELASYTKQLAAFSVPYEEIYETTKRLGDISAGVGIDMSRLILAFGQVRSAEFLKGTELRQFTEAGIPLLDKLADKFTELSGEVVTVGDVLDKISRREVSFQMVRDVLWDLTNEGGQFYNMQGVLAETLAGKLSNLRDAYNIMLADMADSNNTMFSTGIDFLTKTLKHWEDILKIIGPVTVGYFSYKVAVLLAAGANSAFVKSLSMVQITQTIHSLRNLITSFKTLTGVSSALNLALKRIAWPVAIISGAITAIYMFSESEKTAAEISNDLAEALAKLHDRLDSIANNDRLIDEYETLTKKQEKTAEETNRLSVLNKQLSKSFKGAEDSVDDYGRALSMSVSKMREMSQQQKENIKGGLEVELKEAERKLKQVERSLLSHIQSLKILEKGEGIHIGNREKAIDKQKRIIADLQEEYTFLESTIESTKKQLNELFNPVNKSNKELSEWIKIVQEARKINKWIPDANENTGHIDYIQKLNGVIDDLLSQQALLQKDNKLTETSYNSLNDKLIVARGLLKDIGGVEKKTQKEENNDPVAKKYENRLELMKDAMRAYQEYEELYGKDIALGKVKGDTRFSGIDFDPEEYRKNLIAMKDELEKVMGGNEKRLNVFQKIGDALIQFDTNDAKKSVRELMDAIEEAINDETKNWNLFNELVKKGLTKEIAMNVAFSKNMEFDSFAEKLKSDIIKTITDEQLNIKFEDLINMSGVDIEKRFGTKIGGTLAKYVSEYKKQNAALYSDTIKTATDILLSHLSTEDKIVKIKEDTNKKIKDLERIRNGSAYDAVVNRSINKLREEEAEDIASVQFEAFKKTKEWGKAFGDLEKVSTSSLSAILSKLKEFRDSVGHNLDVDDFKELNNVINKLEKDLTSRNPFKQIAIGLNSLKKAEDADSIKAAWGEIGQGVNGVNDMVGDLTQSLGAMFDALGNESASDIMDLISGLAGGIAGAAKAAGQFASGDVVGGTVSAITSISGIITSIAQFHDKKLDRAIKKSELEVKKLENAYNSLGRTIERQLGGIIKEQSDEMLRNLELQREEIEKQMALEDEKKKTDKSKMEDYRSQLEEIGDQIKYFYEDLAKDQYGVDLKSWASDLSSAIVDAFANGEDAAVAFNNTVSNILQDIVKEAVNLQFIQPAMDSLRDYLFGSKGIFTDNSELGTAISDKEAFGLTQQIVSLSSTLGLAEDFWNKVNEATGGLLESTEKSNSSLTGDIKENITEETASLLASYLNAIRADVSVNRKAISNIESVHLPTISVVAQAQLQQLNAIADNTRQNAEYARTIRDAISSVITQSNNGKAIRIK